MTFNSGKSPKIFCKISYIWTEKYNIYLPDLQNLHNPQDYLAGTLYQLVVWQEHLGLIYA